MDIFTQDAKNKAKEDIVRRLGDGVISISSAKAQSQAVDEILGDTKED